MARNDRPGQGGTSTPRTPNSGIPVPTILYYVAAFIVGIALELIFPTSWPSSGVRLAVTLLAGGAWLALDVVPILQFGEAGTSIFPMGNPTTALVTSGPYRITRNPQYPGITALYVAFAFGFGVMWALALLPAVLMIVNRCVIPREERYLEAKFGDEYRSYKMQVRRWL